MHQMKNQMAPKVFEGLMVKCKNKIKDGSCLTSFILSSTAKKINKRIKEERIIC